ncbi:MAG: glycogen debranching protein GlgX [Lautropia sp.]|nr:glycogen debranching protein GlgX [Lautropia sp.]
MMTESTSPGAALSAGQPWPLGATCQNGGVNFAVFSSGARSVTLCLFDDDGNETARHPLHGPDNHVWHGFLPDAGPGLIYGYRVDGPYEPAHGLRYNPSRLLLDPYARRLHGQFQWHQSHLDRPDTMLEDNAAHMPKAVVTGGEADAFDWGDDQRPNTPMAESLIYEVHVKGFSQNNPDVPEALRGTYAGMAAPASIQHLKRIGVTAVELLPVQESISEGPLLDMGLCNYWGYNTLAFFAPDRRYARQDPIREFREMVKALHAAGIEVLLDVVYNHTPEGDQRGPTLSWRGLDNAAYYHLSRQDPAYYANYTGTGNSLNASHPATLQMVLDSLRYWVEEMHVDGFRFDLASTLGRLGLPGHEEQGRFDRYAPFFQAIRQDPVLSRVKLIAEPWDAADGGYQLGAYLPGWSEWNDRFRDTVRSFWLQPDKNRGAFAAQLSGASEQFHHDGRNPQASINFVTSHDGFTLNDLVSYNSKHNEANGEDNRDGNNNNLSWNAGAEGPTGDASILRIRARLKRALLGSLMLAQGVPMLTAGDEMGRTQQGNNNAYNQDNAISWLDWQDADQDLIEYTHHLVGLRRAHPQLRLANWLLGTPTASGTLDVRWLNANGEEMRASDWPEHGSGVFGQLLGVHDDTEHELLILFNPDIASHHFVLPAGDWVLVLDGDQPDGRPQRATSADSEIDEAMTQIMQMGLSLPASGSRPLTPARATDADAAPLSPSHQPVAPAALTPRRPSHLLQAHCLYLFVARRKPRSQ